MANKCVELNGVWGPEAIHDVGPVIKAYSDAKFDYHIGKSSPYHDFNDWQEWRSETHGEVNKSYELQHPGEDTSAFVLIKYNPTDPKNPPAPPRKLRNIMVPGDDRYYITLKMSAQKFIESGEDLLKSLNF